MGATKTEAFTKEQNEISLMLKAMGHPARVAIIDHLMRVNACICNDIVDELPLAQPTISQHLKELKTAGLISGSVEGKAICYCIDIKGMERLRVYLNNICTSTKNPFDTNCTTDPETC